MKIKIEKFLNYWTPINQNDTHFTATFSEKNQKLTIKLIRFCVHYHCTQLCFEYLKDKWLIYVIMRLIEKITIEIEIKKLFYFFSKNDVASLSVWQWKIS